MSRGGNPFRSEQSMTGPSRMTDPLQRRHRVRDLGIGLFLLAEACFLTLVIRRCVLLVVPALLLLFAGGGFMVWEGGAQALPVHTEVEPGKPFGLARKGWVTPVGPCP